VEVNTSRSYHNINMFLMIHQDLFYHFFLVMILVFIINMSPRNMLLLLQQSYFLMIQLVVDLTTSSSSLGAPMDTFLNSSSRQSSRTYGPTCLVGSSPILEVSSSSLSSFGRDVQPSDEPSFYEKSCDEPTSNEKSCDEPTSNEKSSDELSPSVQHSDGPFANSDPSPSSDI
jgi:hypothetical protein